MDAQLSHFTELQSKIARLERQNRRFKRFGTAGLIFVALLIVMGQAYPSRKVVEANDFILRDDSGNMRARLFVTEKLTRKMSVPGIAEPVQVTFAPRSVLALYDDKGQTAAFIDDDSLSFTKSHVLISGGILTIGDDASALVVSQYSVGLYDEQGYQTTLGRRALVTARSGESHLTSAASITMFDKNKNVIWKAP